MNQQPSGPIFTLRGHHMPNVREYAKLGVRSHFNERFGYTAAFGQAHDRNLAALVADPERRVRVIDRTDELLCRTTDCPNLKPHCDSDELAGTDGRTAAQYGVEIGREYSAREIIAAASRPCLTLDEVRLESGETLVIKLVQPPAPDFVEPIWRHQVHMNGNDWYRRIFRQRLEGKYAAECVDTYFLGEIAGEIVGLIWYGYAPNGSGVGNWGDVLTAHRHRGKGIMKHLLKAFTAHHNWQSTARALLCGANPKAMNSYEKIGWRLVRPTASGGGPAYLMHPVMLKHGAVPADFDGLEREYYAPGQPVTMVPGTMRHRHDVDRLLSFAKMVRLAAAGGDYARICGQPDAVLDRRLGPAHAVVNFMQAVFAVEDGRGALAVALTPGQSVVGWAFCLAPASPLEADARVLDCSVHPNYAGQAAPLLKAALDMAQAAGTHPVQAWCFADDAARTGALRDAGLKERVRLKQHARLDGQRCDVLVMTN